MVFTATRTNAVYVTFCIFKFHQKFWYHNLPQKFNDADCELKSSGVGFFYALVGNVARRLLFNP